MKLRNLILTAALFVSAGIVSVQAADTFSYQDFANLATETNSKTLDITMFEFNGSNNWTYYLYGATAPDENGATQTYRLKLDATSAEQLGKVIAQDKQAANAAIQNMTLPDGIDVSKSHEIYSFSIPIDDSITSLTLSGSNPGNNKTSTIDITTALTTSEANNGMNMNEYENASGADALVHAKSSWNLNNGALFLVAVNEKSTGPAGSPLPAPVVTLLIALGFGAALVMYRNRKLAKA